MSYDTNKYRPGLGRSVPTPRRAHLYEIGDHCMDFQLPMCSYGWNRDSGESYSIWRGNVGADGICKLCVRRASKGLHGVKDKLTKAIEKFPPLKACPKCCGTLSYWDSDGFVGCERCDFTSEAIVKEELDEA